MIAATITVLGLIVSMLMAGRIAASRGTVDESMDMVRRYFRAARDLGGMAASGATGAEPRWCQRALTVGTHTPCAAVSSG
jgi:hypothetical protein